MRSLISVGWGQLGSITHYPAHHKVPVIVLPGIKQNHVYNYIQVFYKLSIRKFSWFLTLIKPLKTHFSLRLIFTHKKRLTYWPTFGLFTGFQRWRMGYSVPNNTVHIQFCPVHRSNNELYTTRDNIPEQIVIRWRGDILLLEAKKMQTNYDTQWTLSKLARKNHIVHVGGTIQYLFHIRYWGTIKVIDSYKVPAVDSDHVVHMRGMVCPCPPGLRALLTYLSIVGRMHGFKS